MKKIFVSQPLRGLNKEESKAARTIACKMAIKKIADKYGEKLKNLKLSIHTLKKFMTRIRDVSRSSIYQSQSNSLLMQTMLILEQDGNMQEGARLSTLVLRNTVSR